MPASSASHPKEDAAPPMITVLFVCTGNTCRSPIAEGLLRLRASAVPGLDVRAVSAGTMAATGAPASTYAVMAAAELGADISGHRSQPLTADMVRQADLVLALAAEHDEMVTRLVPEARDRTVLLAGFGMPDPSAAEDVVDPVGMELDAYQRTAHEIDAHIRRVLLTLGDWAQNASRSRSASDPRIPGRGRS